MTVPLWRNPKVYGLLGFILVAAPSLFFFFMGVPGTSVTETEYAGGNKTVVTETVWVGSLFVLAFSILGIFSIGLLTLPGAVLLLIGAAFKTYNKST